MTYAEDRLNGIGQFVSSDEFVGSTLRRDLNGLRFQIQSMPTAITPAMTTYWRITDVPLDILPALTQPPACADQDGVPDAAAESGIFAGFAC
jgi:hypothetical protein